MKAKAKAVPRVVQLPQDCLNVELGDDSNFVVALVSGRIYVTVNEADRKLETPRREVYFEPTEFAALLRELMAGKEGAS